MMMNKKQSSKSQLGKYVLLIPMIMGSLLIFGVSKAYDVSHAIKVALDETVAEEEEVVEIASIEAQRPISQDSVTTKTIRITGQKIDQGSRDSIAHTIGKSLFVIDGIVQEEGFGKEGMKTLEADEIESMTVLKGQSATSLYGNKGKHGVILIATKKAASKSDGVKEGEEIDVLPMIVRTLVRKEMNGDSSSVVTIKGRKVEGDSIIKKGVGRISFKKGEDIVEKGKVLGLVIRDSSSILLNGDSKNVPLILIDGQEGGRGAMVKLNPASIKSVSIYKDAESIRIYGEKGQNGVIVIETKE